VAKYPQNGQINPIPTVPVGCLRPASQFPALQSPQRRTRHLGTPPGWITGIPGPGPDPDPDSITTTDLHPLIRARLPATAIAARLAATADHVLLAATRNPAPHLRSGNPAHPPTGP
jgi:hypothetical protein